MEFKAGDRVKVESESTESPARTGVVDEVVHGAPSPRYRISWDTGTRASTHPRRVRWVLRAGKAGRSSAWAN